MNRNLLGSETSPYLLQHRDNPVWWHPWGAEAFERARREDKPVFLSIGYSTCYWCHVMEHDSFEQASVAEVLNKHFVSIKVDREELPDVDQIYMDVVVGIHGHGGWPMSVFLTPDRKPFWGGTFFYRDVFIRILEGIAQTWATEREKVASSSAELMRYLESKQERPAGEEVTEQVISHAVEQLLLRLDRTSGGFGGAPKFPPTQQLQLLMRMHAVRGDAATLEATRLTLSGMGRGGLFDQVGGGFHRYSVDAEWRIPHFEKMLYDNGLLAQVYLEAFQLTGDPLYRRTAARTLDYLTQEMQDEGGGFCSAEDAGEVEREGEFYAWRPDEVRAVVGEAIAPRLCDLLDVTEEGNFEHGTSIPQVVSQSRWGELEENEIQAALMQLLERRATRVRPHRDTKVLAGWNGLAITALARGYQVLGDDRFRESAVRAGSFVWERMWSKAHGLSRRFCAGSVGIQGVLEDYAYLIEGFLALFSSSGEQSWLDRAAVLQDEQDRRLWSAEHGAYRSSASEGLIVTVCEWGDGATPSPNGISLSNLTVLSELTGEERFEARAAQLERGIPKELLSYPAQFCSTLRAIMLRRAPPSVVVAVRPAGERAMPPQIAQLRGRFLPFTTVVLAPQGSAESALFKGRVAKDDRPTFYVCRCRTCLEPTVDVKGVEDVCSPRKLSNGGLR